MNVWAGCICFSYTGVAGQRNQSDFNTKIRFSHHPYKPGFLGIRGQNACKEVLQADVQPKYAVRYMFSNMQTNIQRTHVNMITHSRTADIRQFYYKAPLAQEYKAWNRKLVLGAKYSIFNS